MKLKWYGTASVEMECAAGRILFDPFVPLYGLKVDVTIKDFDGFSDIFITHGHFDHIYSLPELVHRNRKVKIHCTKAPYATLIKKGIPEENLELIQYGQTISKNGFTIQVLRGKHAVLPKASVKRFRYAFRSHTKRNLPRILLQNVICREKDETVLYRIEAEEKMIVLAGSLNLRHDVKYPTGADLLILPYCGWEDIFTPAVLIIERLKPKRVLLDHYDDTFPPVTMPLNLSPILDEYNGLVSVMQLKETELV